MKKIVKILETRPQSSKNAQNLIYKKIKNYFENKLIFQGYGMAKLSILFDILRPHFQNSFVPILFYVCCAKLKDETQKAIENRTPV